jgi:hypothetical protein
VKTPKKRTMFGAGLPTAPLNDRKVSCLCAGSGDHRTTAFQDKPAAAHKIVRPAKKFFTAGADFV